MRVLQSPLDFDFTTKQPGAAFDPAAPRNESPNNTGAKILPPAQPALIYWPYGESKEFPILGQGGRTACAGPVFRFRPEFKETGGFPEHFDNCLLFYDWQRPFIRWARLDNDSKLVSIEAFTAAVTVVNVRDKANQARARGEFVIGRAVDSQFGPDGCLYLLDYGETWGANDDSQLIKISYQWGNVAPIAKASASPTAGREPLQTRLSSTGSKDHDGEQLRYKWLLHPGARLVSSEATPELTIEKAGNYVVELRVTDRDGATSSANVPLIVGNSAPTVRFLKPQEGDFFIPGEPIEYAVAVQDVEDGRSADYEELFEPRTYVNATWSRGDGKSADVEPGLSHMKQSDCFNCHAVEQKIVGPAFLDVAAKYRGQSEALEASVMRVIKGSTGVWGDVPMLPHESLNPDQVRMMVRWIYALEPGKSGGSVVRGLSGKVTAPKDNKLRLGVLEASYADSGREPAGSLSANASVTLRSPRLEAEFADEKTGPRVLGNFLGAIDDKHHARFTNLNLAGIRTAKFRVASASHGGRIELHSSAPNGPLLAQVEVKPTGSWDKWIDMESPVTGGGRGDVYVVFLNPGKGGLMNLDWVEFR